MHARRDNLFFNCPSFFDLGFTFSGQETCANLQPLHSRCQNSVETEIIRDITHTYTCTRTTGLSVEDRYEKGVVLTHWLGGMLQPQRLTGPYLPWADCAAWYASVIFVGKKRHRCESTMSQKKKKRASDINSLPCGFYMTVIICLSTPWLRRQTLSNAVLQTHDITNLS